MRTIKYRVFDKHKKYMHELDALFLDEKMFRVQNYKNEHDVFSFGTEYFSEPIQFTGLLDKNGIEIYADSSIVEFNYKNVKQYGYFSFDDTVLAYVIKLFNSKQTGISAYLYSKFTIENIKIIDTIQENKLNLFKNTP